jgi:UDP-N-acetylglucosamine 2-epimerase (non-hydrolysing)
MAAHGGKSRKIALVFGTRPEAIKLAPVICQLREHQRLHSVAIVTAQHREILDQVLAVFGIQPDYDLNLMRPGQDPFTITRGVLEQLRSVLEAEYPDILLVQGDTTSSFGAALSAFYLKIPIGHVEAGLRSFKKYQPFPEEINRRLTSVMADWHFAPTELARQNLMLENVSADQIFVTGNTVVDALQWIVHQPVPAEMTHLLESLGLKDDTRRMILVTTHRRENWGEPTRRICLALRTLVERHPDIIIAFSVHPNPIVRQMIHQVLAGVQAIHLLDPIPYLPFVHLMAHADIILTDSGGIQEEAPSLGKPVLVLREVTERPEGVEAGVLKVVGTETERIVVETSRLLTDPDSYARMARQINPYGDGRAAERIVLIFEKVLGV